MKELVKDAAIDLANLLVRFSFDLNGSTAEQLVSYWLSRYPTPWVQFALVEALYQGRYKARSIQQILALWQRRGYPVYHFNHEFERIVRGRFSRHLLMQPSARSETSAACSKHGVASQAVEVAEPAHEQADYEQADYEQADYEQACSQPYSQLSDELTESDELMEELRPEPFTETLVNPSEMAEPLEESSETDLLALELLEPELSEADAPEAEFLEPAGVPAEAPLPDHDVALSKNDLHLLSSAESIAFLKLHRANGDAAQSAKELPIQAFRPVIVFQSETITKMKELVLATSRLPIEPIEQFVPTAAPSDFYSKLKAVATERLAENSGAS